MENNRIICLGTNCSTRYFLTKSGVKPSKEDGELSMPFDLAVHFPENIPYLVKTKFRKYLKGLWFDEKENVFRVSFKKHWWNIHKTNFAWLNHDGDLGRDIVKVKQRYKKRIENFLSATSSKEKLFFVQTLEHPYDYRPLIQMLRKKYSNFYLLILDFSGQMPTVKESDITIISCPYPYKDYIWFDSDQRNSPKGKTFENNVVKEIKKFFKQLELVNTQTEYNLIVSIGSGCSCSYHLRKNNLQTESLPFDWVTNNSGLKIVRFFKNNFSDWCSRKNLQLKEKQDDRKYLYQDILNDIVFVHDFTENIKKEYKKVHKKYKRRTKRLLSKLKKAKSVLFVYETPDINYKDSDLYDFINTMNKKYRKKHIDLLYLIHDEKAQEPVYTILNPNITVVNFDNRGKDWTGNAENWAKVLSKYTLKEPEAWYKRLKRYIKKLG